MRIILDLKANNAVSREVFLQKYYSAMNAYIYRIMQKDSILKKFHNEKGFKGFCFSSLNPLNEPQINEGRTYSIIVSSPMPKIIETLFFGIKDNELLNLGEGSFILENASIKDFKLRRDDVLKTTSIINLTKHIDNKIKAVLFTEQPQEYKAQLAKNLIRKHNRLANSKIDETFDLFSNVEIEMVTERKYAIPIIVDETKIFNCIGNKLRFKLGDISEQQLQIFQLCFDAGFGERNSYGMGFMVRKG